MIEKELMGLWLNTLASKSPVPGGGGASALVAAVGTALGNMVGSLTVGKKKYADVEDEMWELKAKCDQLQKDFLRLIERDAEVFEPLSKAYGMPRETEEEKAEKARVMEIVLKGEGAADAANAAVISTATSRVRVAVEPTNEEWIAARHAQRLLATAALAPS